MTNTPQSSSRSGFTLVEVMIAMVITSFLLASAFLVVSYGFKVLEQARDNTRVAQILQSEMEAVRGMNFQTITSDLFGDNVSITLDSNSKFAEVFGDRYTLNRTVRLFDSNSDQYEVIFRAQWTVDGRTRQQEIRTLVTKDGINDYYYSALTPRVPDGSESESEQ